MLRKRRRKDKKTDMFDVAFIHERFMDSPDIIQKEVYMDRLHEACFIYVQGLVDKDLVQRDFISPILKMSMEELSDPVCAKNLPCREVTLQHTADEAVNSIIDGNTVFVSKHLPFAISCTLLHAEQRSIEEPATEKNVRGAHDGFIEALSVNISILRQRIKNDKLKFKMLTLGEQTRQKVAIAYLDGIANMDIVNNLFDKVSRIKIDGLGAIGAIEQSIISHPNSLFPQFLATERPDRAVAGLLEGGILLLMEGTPVTLIAPVTFISFFKAMDDYNTQWIHGTFLRMPRMIALFTAVLLPAFYVAVTSYHYYTVPLILLIPLAESRIKGPFPPILEVLILEVTIEAVREAAVRLPTYIGTAISVFAVLIIGQAAVQAGIVSNLLIVIVATTAIALFTIPQTEMSLAIRTLRFGFILAASIFGIVGIAACLGLTIAHLVTMDSLGQPYFQPFIPLSFRDLSDTLFRLPRKNMGWRPLSTKTKNKYRGKGNGRK